MSFSYMLIRIFITSIDDLASFVNDFINNYKKYFIKSLTLTRFRINTMKNM